MKRLRLGLYLLGGGLLGSSGALAGLHCELDVGTAVVEWNQSLEDRDWERKRRAMSKNTFAFFRATNHLFWACLGDAPDLQRFGGEDTRIWIQGDLHPDNFGRWLGTNGLRFDLNDFDEAVLADYQIDLWRMAAALFVIARQQKGFSDKEAKMAVETFVISYVRQLSAESEGRAIEHPNWEGSPLFLGTAVEKLLDKGKVNSRQGMLNRYAPGGKFDVARDKLKKMDDSEKDALYAALGRHRGTVQGTDYAPDQLTPIDAALRVGSGLGSFGVKRFYVLVRGKTESPFDNRILDIKQQPEPTGLRFADRASRAEYRRRFEDNHGQRHAWAQLALTGVPDEYSGWMQWGGEYYSIRERSVAKGSLELTRISAGKDWKGLAQVWGTLLAHAHIRGARAEGNMAFSGSVLGRVKGEQNAFVGLVSDMGEDYARFNRDAFKAFVD
ncbi:MAG: DUF2252 family protein [Chromatiales bacterium]|nr:DUF2252 family protein [Chromatiales bacterium]